MDSVILGKPQRLSFNGGLRNYRLWGMHRGQRRLAAMPSLSLFALGLAVVLTEAHSEMAFGGQLPQFPIMVRAYQFHTGSSLLDQSTELMVETPRHRLDTGIQTRRHHPRKLGQPGNEAQDWRPTLSNLKNHPTGLVSAKRDAE